MRRLRCTTCRDTITVYELPREFIDPSLYVCGSCLHPVDAPQFQFGERVEERVYDPAIAAIPF